MQAVTITQITPDELENIFERSLRKILSTQTPQPQPPQRTGNATRKEAATYLGITLPTLHQHTLAGKIKGNRIGRRVLYRWPDLDAAMNEIKKEAVK